tara:strand:+ start:10934 stop:13297 length:2364 start_codon:yes stop_codon:yes gene_type:complete
MAFNFGLVPAGLVGFEQGIGTAEKMRTTAEAIAASQRAEEVRQRAEAERVSALAESTRLGTGTASGLTTPFPGGAATPTPSFMTPKAGPAVYPGGPQGVAPAGAPATGATGAAAPTAPASTPTSTAGVNVGNFSASVIQNPSVRQYPGATLERDIANAQPIIRAGLRSPLSERILGTTGPKEAQRAFKDKAATWFASDQGKQYFMQNPDDLSLAKENPLQFYNNVVVQGRPYERTFSADGTAVTALNLPAFDTTAYKAQPLPDVTAAARYPGPEAAAPAAPIQTPIGNIAPAAPAAPAAAGPTAPAAPAAPAAARAPGKVTLPPQIDSMVTSTAQQYGISPDSLRRLVYLESKGDPLAKSDKSSAAGLLQFTTDTARQFGLTNPFDPVASLDAGARLWTANKQYLSQALGRAPTDGELYLAHQQGAAGARALLANPEQKAVDALTSVYGGDKQRALTALTNNGGTASMTAGQFADKWTSKFGGASGVAGATEVPVELKRVQEQRQQYEQTYTQQQAAAYQAYASTAGTLMREREILAAATRSALAGGNPEKARGLQLQLAKLDGNLGNMQAQYQLGAALAQTEAKSKITELDTMAARKAGEAGIQQLMDNGQPQMTEQLLQYATGAPHRLVSAEGGFMVERNGTFVLGTDNQPRVFTPDQFKQFFFERTDAGYRQMIAEDRAKVLEAQRATSNKIEEIVAGKIAELNIEQFKQASQTQREAMLAQMNVKTAVVGEKVYIVEGNRVYSIDENRAKIAGVTPAALQQVGTVGANGAIQMSTARPQAGLQ